MAKEKVKKSIFKKWWFWVIAVIILISIASGGGEEQPTAVEESNEAETASTTTDGNDSADNSSEETSSESDEVEEEPKEEEPAKTEFAVGEAVQLGDNVLTVTEVQKSNGGDFDTPKSGNEYVIVTVKIENAGEENISYNPFNFKMANSKGQILDQAFTIVNSDTELESGELAPGGTVSGSIAFEQPKDDPALQLQFEPSFWTSEMVKVNLQ